MVHDTYKTMIKLVKSKKLKEPFYPADIIKSSRAKNIETLRKFSAMHRKGNPGGATELLVQLKDGRCKLIRPFKYGIK